MRKIIVALFGLVVLPMHAASAATPEAGRIVERDPFQSLPVESSSEDAPLADAGELDQYSSFDFAGSTSTDRNADSVLGKVINGQPLTFGEANAAAGAAAGCNTLVGLCYDDGCEKASPAGASCLVSFKSVTGWTCDYTTTRKPSTCSGKHGCSCVVPFVTSISKISTGFGMCPQPGTVGTTCKP